MQTHVEYAVSNGEGTLLEYGVQHIEDFEGPSPLENQDATMIMKLTDETCETGK